MALMMLQIFARFMVLAADASDPPAVSEMVVTGAIMKVDSEVAVVATAVVTMMIMIVENVMMITIMITIMTTIMTVIMTVIIMVVTTIIMVETLIMELLAMMIPVFVVEPSAVSGMIKLYFSC